MKTLDEMKMLIWTAQNSKDHYKRNWAVRDIIEEIQKYYMWKHIAKYTKVTVSGLDAEDIKQVFLIGVAEAIPHVDINIGDPVMYLIQKGKWSVLDLLRKHYRNDLRQYCHACSTETRLYEKGGVLICPVCGETGHSGLVERISRNNLDDGTHLNFISDESSLEDTVISNYIVEQFRNCLSGRRREVFDLIVMLGYDRYSCKNYIKDVANLLGVTPSNVNIRLRQIKKAWCEYIYENTATNDI